MEKTMIVFNKIGNTLDIWFDDPKKEAICEETGEEIILKKDKKGRIIGIEKLNVAVKDDKMVSKLPFEIVVE